MSVENLARVMQASVSRDKHTFQAMESTMLLERSAWYDIARDTNWTQSYVTEADMFPEEQSDTYGIPTSEWETFDEPFKVSYREYVSVQREKDTGAYSVKAALARSKYYETADPGYLSLLKLHYTSMAFSEYQTAQACARMARFSKAPSMRNVATFGTLDELRHAQIQLYFAHQFVGSDRQYDWAVQAHHTKNPQVLTSRHALDDVMLTHDAITTSLMLNLAFETGLTNVQMIGLSADAGNMGDYVFANLITSIQSDEARHAQIASPLIEILLRNGKKEQVQRAVDIAFWRIWKTFAMLTGIPMDYWFPLDKRDQSFKEYMQEFVVVQYEQQLRDLGLDRPWYWDHLMEEIESHHHVQHAFNYASRRTLWWQPRAGVSPEERAWLEEKYPGWTENFGEHWDVVTDNLLQGNVEKTHYHGMSACCNLCLFPIANKGGKAWQARPHTLEHSGRQYIFCSEVCRWVFQTEPERYDDFPTFPERVYAGLLGEPTPENIRKYTGIGIVSDGGEDADRYVWVDAYRDRANKAA